MHYYLYQITNKLNSKFYIGVHKTKSLDDGYMGSGTVIRKAVEKYGAHNFEKVILEFFGTQEAMYAKEKEVVDEEFLLREDVYNLRCGGYGGFDYINDGSELHRERAAKGGSKGGKIGGKIVSERDSNIFRSKEFHEANSNHNFKTNKDNQQLGNSPEARAKAVSSMKKTFANIKHSQGVNNSQFGTMWITNGEENKKIKKDDLIPQGWKRGRTVINKV